MPQEAPADTVAALRDLMKGTDTMNIVLIGATGNIGSRILDEALRARPHA